MCVSLHGGHTWLSWNTGRLVTRCHVPCRGSSPYHQAGPWLTVRIWFSGCAEIQSDIGSVADHLSSSSYFSAAVLTHHGLERTYRRREGMTAGGWGRKLGDHISIHTHRGDWKWGEVVNLTNKRALLLHPPPVIYFIKAASTKDSIIPHTGPPTENHVLLIIIKLSLWDIVSLHCRCSNAFVPIIHQRCTLIMRKMKLAKLPVLWGLWPTVSSCWLRGRLPHCHQLAAIRAS